MEILPDDSDQSERTIVINNLRVEREEQQALRLLLHL